MDKIFKDKKTVTLINLVYNKNNPDYLRSYFIKKMKFGQVAQVKDCFIGCPFTTL